MGFTRRTLVADCEISTGMLSVSQLPPIFVGEAGALDVNVTLKLNGQAYTPTGVTASMHLYWPGTTLQTEYVQMTVNGNVVSGRFTNLLTALPGSPLLIIRIKEASTNDIIVATATPIRIWQTRGESIVNPTPGPKSSIKSVDGQEPDETGNIVLYDSHIPSDVITGQNTVALALAYLNTYKANAADVYTKQEVYNKLEVYNKTEIETLISTLFRYKGNKATYAEIEAITTKAIGDVWFCLADSSEYAWDGSKWEKLGPIIDLSAYLTQFSIAGLTIDADHTTITAAQFRTALDIYTKSEVDTALLTKVDKVAGKGLSTNDYDDTEKAEVAKVANKADKTIEINGHNLSADFDISAHEITADGIGDKTVTGNPLVVEDAIESTAKKIVVGLEPIQDLHGYDAPWPAGGNINEFPPSVAKSETINGITVSTTGNGVYEISGTASENAEVKFDLSIPVTIPDGTSEGTHSLMLFNSFSNYNVTLSFYNNNVRIDSWGCIPANRSQENYMALSNKYCNKISIAVQSGQTVTGTVSPMIVPKGTPTSTAFTPYSNICPISGRTEATVTRTGKNLYDISKQVLRSNNAYLVVSLKPNVNYTFSVEQAITGLYVDYSDKESPNPAVVSDWTSITFKYNNNFITFATQDHKWYRLVTYEINGVQNHTYQLELGSTATAYEPYKDETYPITFPQSAGTVYGGTLTVHNDGTGELVVDSAEVDLGTLSWTKSGNFFRTIIQDIVTGKNYSAIVCSSYATKNGVGQPNLDKQISQNSSSGQSTNVLFVNDTSYSDADTFKTAMSDVQFVYELVTPITYTITTTQVQLLEAYNCLFTDGNTLSLTYLGSEASNVQDEIDEFERVTNNILASIAPVETSTASASHAIGSYIMLNNQFCKVTTAIAAGETIAIGRNVTKTTLAQELLAIINS